MDFFKQFKLSICLTPTPLALALGLICSGVAPLDVSAQPHSNPRDLPNVLVLPEPGSGRPYARSSGWDTDTQPFFEPNPGDQENVRDAARKSCDSTSGNPVMLSTGNKIETHTDFEFSGEMPLTLERSYNRLWTYKGLFGMNWVSSYDYSLNVPNAENRMWVQRPDGRRILFAYDKKTDRWLEDKPDPVAFVEVNMDGTLYTHHTEDGGIERYDAGGFPLSIHNRHGIGWTYQFLMNALTGIPSIRIRHSSGRSMELVLDPNDRRVTAVIGPNKQQWTFNYDLNQLGAGRHRLREVVTPGPNATTTRYHYEKAGQPDALTGVSYNNARYSTFDYDSQFRATLSKHGSNINQFTYTYVGQTTPGGNGPADPPDPQCQPAGVCPIQPVAPDILARGAEYEALRAQIREPMVMSRVTELNPLGRDTEHDLGGDQQRITESRGAATANCPSSLSKRFL